jgi:hypothetical protein
MACGGNPAARTPILQSQPVPALQRQVSGSSLPQAISENIVQWGRLLPLRTRRGVLHLQGAGRPPAYAGGSEHPIPETPMSPLMIRIFTLVGIALAAASMQLRARAGALPATHAVQPTAAAAAQPLAPDHRPD